MAITNSECYSAFRDHFLFVGPAANPANISGEDDIMTIFSDLHAAAESGVKTVPSVKFLSRYDKSATNIKESLIWAGIGQVSRLCLSPLIPPVSLLCRFYLGSS